MLKRLISRIRDNNLLKSVASYGLADLMQKAISFITLPVFSYYIIPEELGFVANFDVLVNIIVLISGQATINALTYFFYNKTKKENAILISNLVFIVLIMNLVCGLSILFISGAIIKYLAIGVGFQIMAVLCASFSMLSSVNSIVYRLEENPKAFVWINIASSVATTVLMVYFVVCQHLGGVGKIYGYSIALFVFCIINVILLYRRGYIILKICNDDIKKLLKFGLPLLPHSLSFWIKSGMDKILITTFCGLAANGQYSMAMGFGAIYNLFQNSFNNAYSPYLQKRISKINPTNEEQVKEGIVSLSYKIMIGFVFISIMAIVASWFIINYLLSDRYAESFHFIPWIMVSLMLRSIYSLTVEFAYTSKKTAGIGLITFTGSVIQCILTYFFILIWNLDGVKYSLVIGSLIITIAIWIYSNCVYPMPWLKALKRCGK